MEDMFRMIVKNTFRNIIIVRRLVPARRFASTGLYTKDIVIASAVRTPIANYQHLNVVQLGALAIEGAWKQSAVTKDKISKVYLYSSGILHQGEDNIAKRVMDLCGLNKIECSTLTTDSIDSIRSAAEDLLTNNAKVVIAGSLDSIKNNNELVPADSTNKPVLNLAKRFHLTDEDLKDFYFENTSRLHIAARRSVFDAELLPVRVKKDKKMYVKVNDEVAPSNLVNLNGAAAVVMTTAETAVKMKMYPLVKLVDYEVTQTNPKAVSLAPTRTVRKLLERNKMEVGDIARWEVQSCAPGMTLAFAELTNIEPQRINLHGLCATLEKPINLASICLITHLSHTLQPEDKGVAVVSNDYGLTTAILLEKLKFPFAQGVPQLTLYTKKNCILCDNLIEELNANFAGQFHLKKIYIDEKDSIKYLRLYRNDIPVLFLNGQFLCMHKLNVKLLQNKLELIKLSQKPNASGREED